MSTTVPEYLSSIYVMDGDDIRKPVSLEELNELSVPAKLVVGRTLVGDVEVSTVFLIVRAGFSGDYFFETMIFGGVFDEESWRYRTRAEAQAGHDRIVAALTAGVNPREVQS